MIGQTDTLNLCRFIMTDGRTDGQTRATVVISRVFMVYVVE